MSSNSPNSTLYVHNLNDKVKASEMRHSLYSFFSAYGQIIDIVTLKAPKLRGQAFIVFKDIPSCTNALRQCQSFNFYDKPLKLAYAKSKSTATKELERWVSKNVANQPYLVSLLPEQHRRLKRGPVEDEMAKKVEEKKAKVDEQETEEDGQGAAVDDDGSSKVLFLENLPEEANETMLSLLFEQYPGFKEVRIVPGRTGIAFVEYETDGQASIARDVLNGFKLTPTNIMKVSFSLQKEQQ